MDITVHTMEYTGGQIERAGELRQYSEVLKQYSGAYFEEYRRLYNDSFQKMRTALKITPVECCAGREELRDRQDQIFLLFEGGRLAGSVSVGEKEIDDLIVGREFRQKGYGALLLKFAVLQMQMHKRTPIILHVAEWNRDAVRLYLANGFKIAKTEIIKRT